MHRDLRDETAQRLLGPECLDEVPVGQCRQDLSGNAATDIHPGCGHRPQREVPRFGAVGAGEHPQRLGTRLTAAAKRGLRDQRGRDRRFEVRDDQALTSAVSEAMQVQQSLPADHLLDFGPPVALSQHAHQLQLAIGARGEVGMAGFGRHGLPSAFQPVEIRLTHSGAGRDHRSRSVMVEDAIL